jgi:hypothetical protein
MSNEEIAFTLAKGLVSVRREQGAAHKRVLK